MLSVAALTIQNFGPFRGNQQIRLSPGCYAIVARRADNPERSNWVGKSWFMSAIPFALFGWHLANTEDGIITKGERDCLVRLELSDGTVVQRSRQRGASTQLVLEEQGKLLAKGVAQDRICQLLCMSEQDLFATHYFEQKKIDRLIRAQPAERLAIITEWLSVGALERGEELESGRAAEARRNAEQLNNLAIMDEGEVSAYGDLTDAEARVAALTNARIYANAEEFAAIDARGRNLRTALDLYGDVEARHTAAKADLAEVQGKRGEAFAAYVMAERAFQGEFDGRCPVAGIECPCTVQINQQGRASRLNLEEARIALRQADVEVGLHVGNERHCATERDDQLRISREIDDLRKRARELKPAADWARENPRPASIPAGMTAQQAGQEVERLTRAVSARERARTRRADAAQASHQARVYLAAAKCYRAARKAVAEGAVRRIEHGANQLLEEAGVDLRITIAWGREGKGLASSCDECGRGYEVSQRIKSCPQCGTARGPKQVDRLDVELSDRSGAAEDLAGIAMQLAASQWLRARRSSPWGVVCIDEPLAACDQYHRQRLGQALAAMLGSRCVQAFCIAHDRAICDALPNRIELIGTEKGTTIA